MVKYYFEYRIWGDYMRQLFIILVGLLLLLSGCGSKETVNSNNGNEQKVEKSKYNIEKIVVPVEEEWANGLVAYQELHREIIEYIGKKNNISIEFKEITNFQDSLIALEDGKVDIVFGVYNNVNPEIKTTYSYLSAPLYYPNGVEVAEHESYRIAVHQDNKELLEMLNDEIYAMKENGKLEEIQNKYLEERTNMEHQKLSDLSDWNTLEQMSDYERDTLIGQIEEYSKNKE